MQFLWPSVAVHTFSSITLCLLYIHTLYYITQYPKAPYTAKCKRRSSAPTIHDSRSHSPARSKPV